MSSASLGWVLCGCERYLVLSCKGQTTRTYLYNIIGPSLYLLLLTPRHNSCGGLILRIAVVAVFFHCQCKSLLKNPMSPTTLFSALHKAQGPPKNESGSISFWRGNRWANLEMDHPKAHFEAALFLVITAIDRLH